MVLDTTANGSCGSRGSSRAGVNADRGATAPSGESNTGRFLGAHAAIWVCGGAVFNGAASGLWKSEGRSIGAYSGPSSQVAMQFIVDAAQADAVSAGMPSGSVWIAQLSIYTLLHPTSALAVGAVERNGYA
jgi:hypothetical protein